MEENQLEQLKNGDLQAFDQFILTHQAKVIRICFRFVKNKDDAEDIAQEVFIELYKSLSKFREESKVTTWIYRIAVSKSLDHLK